MARHCQYKSEVFFKEIILDNPVGGTKDAICNEFQESGTPHVHSLI